MIAAACVVALGVYAGAYLSMVKPITYLSRGKPITRSGMSFMTTGAAGWKAWTVATYPMAIGHPKFWERFFAPANAIDKKLRRKVRDPDALIRTSNLWQGLRSRSGSKMQH